MNQFVVERRSDKDRRSHRFGGIRWFIKTGRRRKVRRQADRHKVFVLDYYSPKLLMVLIVILLLSVIDALLTLWLIDQGAMEINPVMAYYLSLGPGFFMGAKYMLTATVVTIGVILNYSFIRFFRLKFEQLLNFFAGCFSLVVVWELYLILQLVF